ncbi:phosphodiester glycosidase family protein [Streptomyces sp. NPDC097981]|uniref:phosphodiester glycosidase family protein n=1 Tax=Streptomyces sp. NPDC097981 TaxID=3155428 RepID=UPI00332AE4AD
MLSLRPLLPVLLAAAVALAGPVGATAPSAQAAGADSDGMETARTGRQIAPGIRLESYDRLESDRWLRIDELLVDLGGSGGLRAEYLGGRGPATVAEAAARHPAGPGRRVVAAVNGDFFDIRGTGAPLGPGLGGGRLLHSATPGPAAAPAAGFGADGSGRVQHIRLDGSVTLPGAAVRPLTGYNAARPAAEGLSAYTSDWPGKELPAVGTAVAVRDGRVTAAAPPVRGPARRERPEPGTTLLAAAADGTAAAELAALRPGDPVAVAVRAVPDTGPVPVAAVGGREALVVAGVPQNHDGEPNNTAAPRTAVGFSRDGRRLRILTVDGRQRDSGGLTLTALGRLMHRLGAYEALNLDGGGSSTLLAGLSGATALALENSPSDGQPRAVPNGIVLTAPAGSGRTAGYRVEPVGGTTEDLTRVFPGLTRTLEATGHDALLGPAAGAAAWSADGAGTIDSAGVFHAVRRGRATVHAWRTTAHGVLPLEVLGPLTRIRSTQARIGLAEQRESAGFRLIGYDAQGAAAVVEPRDVALEFDRSRWSVAEDGRGGFTVTALVPHATGRLRATVRPAGATAAWAASGATARAASGVPALADAAALVARAVSGAAVRAASGAAVPVLASVDAWAASGVTARAASGVPAPADAAALVARAASGAAVPVPAGANARATVGVTAPGASGAAAPAIAGAAGPGTVGVSAEIALGVGLVTLPLADLADGAAWTGTGASPVVGGHPGPGLALDLPGAAVDRSAAPPRALPVPELARSLTLWVGGDGSGARPAVELTDADGAAVTVRGPAVDWTGWREISLALPATAQRPLTVTRLSAAGGTRPGRLVLDTLGARTPPTGPAAEPVVRDPIVATEAGVRARPWRFAIGQAGDAGADPVLTGAGGPGSVHRGVRFLPLDTTRRTLDGGGLYRMRALRKGLEAAAREPGTGALAVVRAYAPDTVDRKETALTAHLLAEFRRTTGKRAAVITIGALGFAAGRCEGVLSVEAPRTGRTVVGVDAFASGDWLAVRHVP